MQYSSLTGGRVQHDARTRWPHQPPERTSRRQSSAHHDLARDRHRWSGVPAPRSAAVPSQPTPATPCPATSPTTRATRPSGEPDGVVPVAAGHRTRSRPAGSGRRSRHPAAPAATRAGARPASRPRRAAIVPVTARRASSAVTSMPWASTPRTEPSSANQGLKVRSQKTSNGSRSSSVHLHPVRRSGDGAAGGEDGADHVVHQVDGASGRASGAISRTGLPNWQRSPNASRAASLALASTMSSPSQASMMAGAVS